MLNRYHYAVHSGGSRIDSFILLIDKKEKRGRMRVPGLVCLV
jgi:hypothetical protein